MQPDGNIELLGHRSVRFQTRIGGRHPQILRRELTEGPNATHLQLGA